LELNQVAEKSFLLLPQSQADPVSWVVIPLTLEHEPCIPLATALEGPPDVPQMFG
jgi:hypothetical protein